MHFAHNAGLLCLVIQLLLQLEVGFNLVGHGLADLIFATVHPHVPARVGHGPQDAVLDRLDPLAALSLAAAGDGIQVGGDLGAIRLEGKIVDVLSEGILNLTPNEEESQDDIRGHHSCWDRDIGILELGQQLEGEHGDVDPGNLADGDRVGDGKRRVADTVSTREHVIEGGDVIVGERLLHRDRQLRVGHQVIGVAGEVRQNLEGEVSKRAARLLDHLAWVAGGKRDAQVLACSLEETGLPQCLEGLIGLIASCPLSKGVKVANQAVDVIVAGVRLVPELVLQRGCKCDNEVERSAVVAKRLATVEMVILAGERGD